MERPDFEGQIVFEREEEDASRRVRDVKFSAIWSFNTCNSWSCCPPSTFEYRLHALNTLQIYLSSPRRYRVGMNSHQDLPSIRFHWYARSETWLYIYISQCFVSSRLLRNPPPPSIDGNKQLTVDGKCSLPQKQRKQGNGVVQNTVRDWKERTHN